MQKTKKLKHTSPVKGEIDSAKTKITKIITDQNTGPQQLYENRKVWPSTKRSASVIDPKEVRQNSSDKLHKLLRKDSSAPAQLETSTKTHTKK